MRSGPRQRDPRDLGPEPRAGRPPQGRQAVDESPSSAVRSDALARRCDDVWRSHEVCGDPPGSDRNEASRGAIPNIGGARRRSATSVREFREANLPDADERDERDARGTGAVRRTASDLGALTGAGRRHENRPAAALSAPQRSPLRRPAHRAGADRRCSGGGCRCRPRPRSGSRPPVVPRSARRPPAR